jgi:hypothetical protein
VNEGEFEEFVSAMGVVRLGCSHLPSYLTETVIALLDDGATAASRGIRTPLYMSALRLARGINGGPE